jgi:putative phosphoesterase
MRIGVISDTHGLLRSEAVNALTGVDHILHAGDVGDDQILDALAEIAPLTAISGNIDSLGRCGVLPPTEWVELSGVTFYMLHDLQKLDIDPVAAEVDVIVSGHSHQPALDWRKGVLYFNPGSAGPRRFKLPTSLGLVTIGDGSPEAKILRLL